MKLTSKIVGWAVCSVLLAFGPHRVRAGVSPLPPATPVGTDVMGSLGAGVLGQTAQPLPATVADTPADALGMPSATPEGAGEAAGDHTITVARAATEKAERKAERKATRAKRRSEVRDGFAFLVFAILFAIAGVSVLFGSGGSAVFAIVSLGLAGACYALWRSTSKQTGEYRPRAGRTLLLIGMVLFALLVYMTTTKLV